MHFWTRSLVSCLLAGASFAGIATSAQADGLQSLSRFVESTQGGKASFNPVSYTHLTLPTTPYV